MTYRWDEALEEWFINDQRGLEHGFTVFHRPERETGCEAPLAFTLAVRGDLRVDVQSDRRGIRFLHHTLGAVLTYTGLTVIDADGKHLSARFESSGQAVELLVDERNARYPLTIDPLVQQGYLKAHNTEMDDFFGCAVAVSGNTVVIGACGEDSNANGVNGDRNDNSCPESGAAYIFVRSGTAWSRKTWSQQAYIKASNTGAGDHFGSAVAISGDIVVIGAHGEDSKANGINKDQGNNGAANSGAAYVFQRKGTRWCQLAYLKASNSNAEDRFGSSVAINADTAVIGAWGESSKTTGVNGKEGNNNRPNAGAAYVFIKGGSSWFFAQKQAYLKASNTDAGDYFGYAVDISGDTILVGASGEDSNEKGVNGDQSDNSAADAGAVYVFSRSATAWAQQAYVKAANTDSEDYFGAAVAIDGDHMVIGAFGEDGDNTIPRNNSATFAGAAYVFSRSGTDWSQKNYLKATNTNWGDRFGYSVGISGDTILIGAPEEDSRATGINGDEYDNSASYSGAAYVFHKTGPSWYFATQRAFVKSSNTGAHDHFAYSVAISGVTVVAGAYGEDSMSTGVNGDQMNKSAHDAGAAYVLEQCFAEAFSVGQGCYGAGPPPVMSSTLPVMGSTMQISVKGAPANMFGVTLLGFTHAGISFGHGCVAFVHLMWPTVPILFNTDSTGSWQSGPFPVSNSHQLWCMRVAVQAGIHHPPTLPLGMAITNAMWLRVGY